MSAHEIVGAGDFRDAVLLGAAQVVRARRYYLRLEAAKSGTDPDIWLRGLRRGVERGERLVWRLGRRAAKRRVVREIKAKKRCSRLNQHDRHELWTERGKVLARMAFTPRVS